MKVKEILEKYPEQLKKLGGIFYALNKIETTLIVTLSGIFADKSISNSETNFVFNDALNDEKIFPTLENKRMLIIKLIKNISRLAEENNLKFDKEKYLRVCRSILKVQNLRNDLGHNFLNFSDDGKVGFYVRISNEERLSNQKSGTPKGTLKRLEFDLDKELEFAEKVCDDCEEIMRELSTESWNIMYKKSS